ncbi:MAG: hypothetical protein KKB74_08390 [Bacteroidetes bacterium]|nr:hypothetical protein [Bacteroidota bacterium]
MTSVSLPPETQEINSPANPIITPQYSRGKRSVKMLLIIGILVLFIIISIGIAVVYALNKYPKSMITNKPSFNTPSLKASFPSPAPTLHFSYAVESNQIMENGYPASSSSYLVKRRDLKTDKTEVIYKIPMLYPKVGVDAGFGKSQLDFFIFSQDQRLIAYNTTELDIDPKSQQPTGKAHHLVHIFDTGTIQDKVIYRESTDLSLLFSFGKKQGNLDCTNQITQSVIEECFNKFEAFHLYDKVPILFSKDNKKLILIGASSFMPESANQGVFVLDTGGYQNTYRILSKNQISKHPLLSPSGKYLLVAITISDFDTAPDNTTINQINTEVSITLYDMATEKISYQKLVNAQPKNNTDQFQVWDPYFLTDQLIVIPTEKQLLILDAQTGSVKETTNEDLKNLATSPTP